MWLGTFGSGLQVVDLESGRVEHVRAEGGRHGLPDDRVTALLHDRRGRAWVGTMAGGLARLDLEAGSSTTHRHDPSDPTSLGADGVMALHEDRAGALWVGTFGGGVNRFDPRTGVFERFEHDPDDATTPSGARVTAFAEDRDGTLWVGTDGGGLGLLVAGSRTFHAFRHDPDAPNTIPVDSVFSLHVDGRDTLWVGTRGGGLARAVGDPAAPDEIRFETFGRREGLPDDVIYGIEPDGSGNLWLSTNRGLARFTPTTGEVRSYRKVHGLQSDEFNFGAHFRTPRGELVFAGNEGFNVFEPARLERNLHAPPVRLTSLLRYDRPVEADVPFARLGRTAFDHRDDVLTFEVAALDFSAPGENRYAMKLEGFDAEWRDLGTDRRVTYTNLDGGEYALRVRAANSDGVWGEASTVLELDVAPAPWLTWWAYLGYLATAALGVLAIVRFERRKVVRETVYSRKLERQVAERTRELADRNAELRAANEDLLLASLTDPLTGLRNRRFFFEEVAREIAALPRAHEDRTAGHALAFLMVDLDHFKSINDLRGHQAGDGVILAVREVFLEICRESDSIVRWGGDEFLVVAHDADPERAAALAERIRQGVEARSLTLGDGRLSGTCSIGFACFPFDASAPAALAWDAVLALADAALYQAKARRNAWAGFRPTARAGAVLDDLARQVRADPSRLVDDGILELLTGPVPGPHDAAPRLLPGDVARA